MLIDPSAAKYLQDKGRAARINTDEIRANIPLGGPATPSRSNSGKVYLQKETVGSLLMLLQQMY